MEIFDGVVEHAEGEELRANGELQRAKAAVREAGDEMMAAREPSANRPTWRRNSQAGTYSALLLSEPRRRDRTS